MKLLFINPGESRHGSTYRARGLCRVLRDLGHQVVYAESNCRDGNDVISIEQANSLLGYLSATLKRCELSLKTDYEIVYLQKAWPLTLGCMIIAKLRKKWVAIDFDDLDSEWQPRPLRKGLMRLTERWKPKYGDFVTTHNRYLQGYIQEIAGCHAAMIPQGIDTELFDPKRFDKQMEKKRSGFHNKRVLCFLGSFTFGSSEDLPFILEAMREVEKRQKNTFFLMIGGEGPLEEKYLRLIKTLGLKHVHITGRIPHDQVPQYLAACDMGLIFMEENRANKMRMSLKLIEYLSMELPVVGHIIGESRDVFGQYCFLCYPSAHSLAEKIIEVLENETERESARDFIARNYDWRAIGHSMAGLLRNLAR